MMSGAAGVWLTLKQNVWCFPVGMTNVALYAWLFFTPSIRLYADAVLQCIYFALLIYGWYVWTKPTGPKKKILPSVCSGKEWRVIIGVTVIVAISSGWFLQSFTNAALPWMDACLTAISLAAQWMVAKKKIENWILWILADFFYIPLYLIKELPLTAFLYLLFLILAFKGWREWKNDLHQPTHA